jgi:hypothetical protein
MEWVPTVDGTPVILEIYKILFGLLREVGLGIG